MSTWNNHRGFRKRLWLGALAGFIPAVLLAGVIASGLPADAFSRAVLAGSALPFLWCLAVLRTLWHEHPVRLCVEYVLMAGLCLGLFLGVLL